MWITSLALEVFNSFMISKTVLSCWSRNSRLIPASNSLRTTSILPHIAASCKAVPRAVLALMSKPVSKIKSTTSLKVEKSKQIEKSGGYFCNNKRWKCGLNYISTKYNFSYPRTLSSLCLQGDQEHFLCKEMAISPKLSTLNPGATRTHWIEGCTS